MRQATTNYRPAHGRMNEAVVTIYSIIISVFIDCSDIEQTAAAAAGEREDLKRMHQVFDLCLVIMEAPTTTKTTTTTIE